MQKPNDDLRQEWQPPARPEWVQRINEEGNCMNISGVVPLDEKSLLEAAIRTTGLFDFGTDNWRDNFRVLIKSLEEDAELNLMGRLMARSEILQLLEARLQIEDWYTRHPEIDDEEIIEPVFVVGQGRSGTSYLINILAANPISGQTRTPCRFSESMHEFGARIPLECMQILALAFNSSWFILLGQATQYEAYIATQDIAPALAYHKRVLKLLQWRNPRKHWVLKDPMHLYRLPQMLKVYPDARFVWPHRDPVRASASTVSFIGALQWARCDHPFKGNSFDNILNPDNAAAALGMVIDQIESGAIPKHQLHNLLYKDLIENTMPTVEAMYRQLGLDLSEEGYRAMSSYLAANPRTARPAHNLKKGSDASLARARQAFERYQQYFGIPSE